jgi:hypothetical protein
MAGVSPPRIIDRYRRLLRCAAQVPDTLVPNKPRFPEPAPHDSTVMRAGTPECRFHNWYVPLADNASAAMKTTRIVRMLGRPLGLLRCTPTTSLNRQQTMLLLNHRPTTVLSKLARDSMRA